MSAIAKVITYTTVNQSAVEAAIVAAGGVVYGPGIADGVAASAKGIFDGTTQYAQGILDANAVQYASGYLSVAGVYNTAVASIGPWPVTTTSVGPFEITPSSLGPYPVN